MPRARRFARLLCGVRVILLGKERMQKILKKKNISERATKKGTRGKRAVPPTASDWRRFAPQRTGRGGRTGDLDARRRHPRNAFKGRNERFYKAEPKRGMTRNRSGPFRPRRPIGADSHPEGQGGGGRTGDLDARRRHPRNAFKGRNERFYKAEPKRGMTRNRSGPFRPRRPIGADSHPEGQGGGGRTGDLDARRRHPRNAFKGRNERFYKAEPKRGMTRNRSGQACPLLFSASKDSPLPAFPEKSGAHRLQRRRAPSVLPGGPEPLSPRAARARERPAFCAKSRRAGTRRG